MSEENKTYLFQMTIPSVQKFISSSRKSSDLWTGSFIVSYLMKKLLEVVVNKYHAELIYPVIDSDTEEELIANIPNVAIFIVENVNENQSKNLKKALKGNFKDLLEDIIKNTLEKFFSEKKIIERYKNEYLELAKYQIKETLKLFIDYLILDKDYKEISENLSNLINYQKKSQLPDREYIENYKLIKPINWECYGSWNSFYNYEKNNKFKTGTIKGVYRCSLCGEHTITGATLEDWKGNTIWQPLWDTNPKMFNRGERLCGVCLAKRYFREYIQEKYKIKGEDLGFPSTSETGATLFKGKILEILKANPDFNSLLIKFLENLEKISNFRFKKVRGNPVPKLENAINEIFPTDKNLKEDKQCKTYKFFQIDGEWFLEDTWKNENDYKVIGADSKKANQILKILKEIYKYLENKGVEKHNKPSEYYAVIMLDGDSIGEKLDLIKDIKTHRNFSKKLSELSKKFKDIVEENYGALIYSGGDDVLALVPVEKALDCANEIQNKFKTTLKKDFPKIDKESPFSMSGAIIYAHHKLPLSYILNETRKCEGKAKDEGKNRVCLKYIKRSLSSAEIILSWNYWKEFKELKEKIADIPNTFIYQLKTLTQPIEYDRSIYKEIIRYLLKKKLGTNENERIKSILENNIVSYNYSKLPEFMKVINFLRKD